MTVADRVIAAARTQVVVTENPPGTNHDYLAVNP